MTTSTAERSSSDKGYRWTCPICGNSKVNAMSEQGRNALRALKTHVYFTDDDGHASANSYPPEYDEESLDEHVTKVDEHVTKVVDGIGGEAD